MHLPSTSNAFILDAFNHRELAGLGCGCMKFQGVGEGPRRGVGDAASNALTSTLVGGGISAGVGLATTVLSSWLADKKQNGALKTYTTTIVNDLEPLLRANANAYMSGPRTCADQAAALNAFDSAWQWLESTQACGNAQLETPGQNCINDRAPGGKWDWTAMYRTPIANDTTPQCNVGADAAEQSAVTNILNKIGGSNVQTNALDFASTQTGAGNSITGSSVGSSVANGLETLLSPSSTISVAGIAIPEVALVGLAVVVVAMFAMDGRR